MSQPSFSEVPTSSNTVSVRIIDNTTDVCAPVGGVTNRAIKGHEHLRASSYSFIVEHGSGRKVLFDLGLRKDTHNLPPIITGLISQPEFRASAERGVHEILLEHGISLSEIEAIVWSHWHYDHTGDPSVFPSSTALIVGPGFKETFLPGYPTGQGSMILESDYEGRELRELDFEENTLVGGFRAVDYFSDGSFYVLDGPGHTIGHLCALARVTALPEPSFVFMGGDCCHHAAWLRPSTYLPLPESISPHPFGHGATPCPGAVFEHLLRDGNRTIPFYDFKQPGVPLSDPKVQAETIEKVQKADAKDNVMVLIAHDTHLKGVIDFFPGYVDDFAAKDWPRKMRWVFLKDFEGACS